MYCHFHFTEDIIEHPAWSSLEDIPRLSSGMLVDHEKLKKPVKKAKQMKTNYRKISLSDQHLDAREHEDFPQTSFKDMSYWETNLKPIYWNHLCENNNRIFSRSKSLRGEHERRTCVRKNGVALPLNLNR